MSGQRKKDIPLQPKIRLVEPIWVTHQNRPYLRLKDPLQLSDQTIMIPQHMVPLLTLMDGTRETDSLSSALSLHARVSLTTREVHEFIAALDSAFLLENKAFHDATSRRLKAYRKAPYRTPSHSNIVYPAKLDDFIESMALFTKDLPTPIPPRKPNCNLAGIVSPHIDYDRGGKTYAELWLRASDYLDDLDLVIVFGTDHSGGVGTFTPTLQNYASPHGVIPTDKDTVDGLAEVIGNNDVYAEEIHHIKEHSIELATVWFHHFVNGKAIPIVPVLCGSFAHFIDGDDRPSENEKIGRIIEYLKSVTSERNTLVIAAGDLSHVGPAFGDNDQIDAKTLKGLKSQDGESIDAICQGDAEGFFEMSRAEHDVRKICGLSPIYMMLRLLETTVGESFGYDQCPADQTSTSYVTITGAMLYN